jgi:hypothetical protein
MKYKSPITYHSKDMANVKVSGMWVKLQGHKVKNYDANRFQGLVIWNTHMKYESLFTYYSKDMANVTVFEKWVKHQGHNVKNYSINRKVLS